jgi:hypothetical protein
MGRELPDKFTGLRIEPHAVLSGEQCIVAYRNGQRVGCLYFKPQGLRFVFEANETVAVEKRIAPMEFERVYENRGGQ